MLIKNNILSMLIQQRVDLFDHNHRVATTISAQEMYKEMTLDGLEEAKKYIHE